MLTANLATIVGLSLVAAALIAVFFSPYRRWLNFMLAGMVYWKWYATVCKAYLICPLPTVTCQQFSWRWLWWLYYYYEKIDGQSVLWQNVAVSNILLCMKTIISSVQAAKSYRLNSKTLNKMQLVCIFFTLFARWFSHSYSDKILNPAKDCYTKPCCKKQELW